MANLQTIDCRGLACPQPVLKTKQALDQMSAGAITVIVDNDAARQNVAKMAQKLGCTVAANKKNGDYYLVITKTEGTDTSSKQYAPQCEVPDTSDTVIFCTGEHLGSGSEELGKVLMKSFFYALTQHDTPPKAVIFMNAGVYLSIEGSPVLDSLQELADKGTEVISCGTCLDYFQIKDKIAVGEISNMYTISEVLTSSSRIIKL